MLKKLIALSVVFGLIVADPVAKLTAPSYDDISYFPTYIKEASSKNEIEAKTFDTDLSKPDFLTVFNTVVKIIGYKASAVSLAVSAIRWLVSNCAVLAIGAIVTIGFCKLTGKCHVIENLSPVALVRNLVTPERLESAEQILLDAMKRYAEEEIDK